MKALWITPILNIVAFFLAIFFGKIGGLGRKNLAHIFTIPLMLASWIIAIVAFVQNIFGHPIVLQSAEWFDFGIGSLRIGVTIDGFATAMALVVTTIALCVEIYSAGYMKGEIRYTQYTATLALFAAGMLILVLADNLFLGIFGWEIMGLTSYLLISHYWEDKENSNAGIKAFITTRTGDVGLILGAIVCFWGAGTFNFQGINLAVLDGSFSGGLLTAAGFLLLLGVVGKSAQVPLHTWLPDAMAGPTPVSALIHAATMVVAGVYLVARLYGVFVATFEIGSANAHLLAIIGGLTAIVGAVLALVQWDIKRVLAYSTISQLGYMIFALGVGAWGAGVFHLFTHAFFKALLFLGSGAVIHAVHSNDMRDMGGLRKKMPITYITWIIGSLALSGVFPLAGFFSKDEILASAFKFEYEWLWVVGLLVAFLTAFYMFRATIITFHGKYRGHGTPHDAGPSMSGVLIFLSIPAAAIGFLGLPGGANLFEGWVETPVVHALTAAHLIPHVGEFTTTTLILAIISLAIALIGIGVAFALFQRQKADDPHFGQVPMPQFIRTTLENRFWLDDLYGGLVYAIREPLARATYWTNQNVIDVCLDITAKATLQAGEATYWFDQELLDNVYNGSAYGTDRVGEFSRQIQTGKVQQYAGVLFAGAAILGIILVVFR